MSLFDPVKSIATNKFNYRPPNRKSTIGTIQLNFTSSFPTSLALSCIFYNNNSVGRIFN